MFHLKYDHVLVILSQQASDINDLPMRKGNHLCEHIFDVVIRQTGRIILIWCGENTHYFPLYPCVMCFSPVARPNDIPHWCPRSEN